MAAHSSAKAVDQWSNHWDWQAPVHKFNAGTKLQRPAFYVADSAGMLVDVVLIKYRHGIDFA